MPADLVDAFKTHVCFIRYEKGFHHLKKFTLIIKGYIFKKNNKVPISKHLFLLTSPHTCRGVTFVMITTFFFFKNPKIIENTPHLFRPALKRKIVAMLQNTKSWNHVSIDGITCAVHLICICIWICLFFLPAER